MLTQIQERQLHEFYEKNAKTMCDELMRLTRVPSVIGEPAPGAPFGADCRNVLEETKRLFAEHGIASQISDDGYLLAYTGNTASERTVGIFAHADVVPVDDNWTVTAPFEPIEKDGFLYGRGIHDNKTGVVAALWSAIAMRELGLPFDKKLIIFVGSNEESGMRDIKAFRDTHGAPDMGLVPDASFPCIRGEKCILRIDAFSDKLSSIAEAYGGEAYNVALGEVKLRIRGDEKWALLTKTAADPEFSRIRLEREGGDIVLISQGLSKHASAPDGSLNAMLPAAKLLAACDIDAAAMSLCAEVLGDYYGGVCGAAHEDLDMGRLTMVNGKVRMADGRLSLGFDIRFGPTMDLEALCVILNDWFTARGWTMQRRSGTYGYKLERDNPMVEAAVDEYARFMGERREAGFMGGGTYARTLGGRTIPVGIELARSKSPELPAGHGGSHQPDECTQCESFIRAAELICRQLLRLGEI